jgi:hypothetical protein
MSTELPSHFQVGETARTEEDYVFVTRILSDESQEVLAFERRAFRWATLREATVYLFPRDVRIMPKRFVCNSRAAALALCAALNTYF